MRLPQQVKLVEVGPRDGLQNEAATVPLPAKVRLIEELAHSGLKTIECGSFVSSRRVPQMADTDKVFEGIQRSPDVTYAALVPNLAGLERAIACRLDEVAVFVSASEGFSQANTHCSIAESLDKSKAVVAQARARGMRVRGYVSCVVHCPYDGAIPPQETTRVARALLELGCYEISLGDTVGTATPRSVESLLAEVLQAVPVTQLAVHFHDTWGQALANLLVALEAGVSTIDSAVAGLGGCPYAPGAAGNVATEDVVYLLDGMGIDNGVNLKKLAAAGRNILSVLGRTSVSKAAIALNGSL